MLTLNEFNKDSIDYQLKNLDHKFGRKVVEYDCKFVKGNFKFKIKITSTPNASTVITVKKEANIQTQVPIKPLKSLMMMWRE